MLRICYRTIPREHNATTLPHSSSGRQHYLCKIADGRQQTTCAEYNATTLPHSSSGRKHHLCARGVSSLCCGELLASEPVIICHPTIPHFSLFLLFCRFGCACPSMRKHEDLCNSNNLDNNPSLYIHVQRGSLSTSISSVFCAKIRYDRQKTTCGDQNTTTDRTMCACRIISLRRRVALS